MKYLLISIALFGFLLAPAMQPIFAATGAAESVAERQGEARLQNPLGSGADSRDVRVIIGRVIKALLGISGAIALIMFIYGGLQWMISGGAPEKIKKGQQTLLWAVLGLAIIFASFALVNFAIEALEGSTTAAAYLFPSA